MNPLRVVVVVRFITLYMYHSVIHPDCKLGQFSLMYISGLPTWYAYPQIIPTYPPTPHITSHQNNFLGGKYEKNSCQNIRY